MNLSILFQFWVVIVAGRINAYQQAIIAYKDEEIRCLRQQLRAATGKERPRFTNAQHVRLAALAFKLGRATLGKINTLVTLTCPLKTSPRLMRESRPWTHSGKADHYGSDSSHIGTDHREAS